MTAASDFSWMIGGPQGSGVESAANIFSRICAEAGYHVFGKREFYSNIKGEHSYFVVRIADREIHSNINGVDLLTAFDADTIFRHFDDIRAGGGILYNSDLDGTDTMRLGTLDTPFRERLHDMLEARGKSFTVSGAVECAREDSAAVYSVSFRTILEKAAEETNNPRLRGLVRLYNTIAVSLSLGITGMPVGSLLGAIDKIFAKKPAVAEMNKSVAALSHAHASDIMDKFAHTLSGVQKRPHTILVQGHQGTALGKMASGCRFQPYYPITPASDESVFLEANDTLDVTDDKHGCTAVIQTEDEICAIGMTIGGALTGTRSATCTSGPGFSLMTEALGWAGINEVPIVITDYQRSGPSTGLPTRHGQDDLLSTIHAGHGDFPKIVYASGSVEESFYDTGNCFNYAETFQVPLIHLMDKFLASTVLTCNRFDTDKITIRRGKLLDSLPEGNNYRRFELTSDGISARSRLGMENGIFWNTGDESDEAGHITEDPVMRVRMMDKRMSRLELILDTIPDEEQTVSFGVSEFTIISWGSAKGPIMDAIRMLREEGTEVGFIQLKLLHPFPAKRVASLLENGGAKTIIDVEANQTGQMGKLFVQNLKREIDYFILKYSGRAMTCTEVYDSLKRIINGTADRQEVLMYGA